MNFVDGITLRFRKQGLSENEIRIKVRRYYFYSKAALGIYLLVFVLSVLLDRVNVTDIFAMVLFLIWFVVIVQLFLQLRNWAKLNSDI